MAYFDLDSLETLLHDYPVQIQILMKSWMSRSFQKKRMRIAFGEELRRSEQVDDIV